MSAGAPAPAGGQKPASVATLRYVGAAREEGGGRKERWEEKERGMECNIAWDKTRGGGRERGREVLQNTEIDLPPSPPRSPSEEGDRGKERGWSAYEQKVGAHEEIR